MIFLLRWSNTWNSRHQQASPTPGSVDPQPHHHSHLEYLLTSLIQAWVVLFGMFFNMAGSFLLQQEHQHHNRHEQRSGTAKKLNRPPSLEPLEYDDDFSTTDAGSTGHNADDHDLMSIVDHHNTKNRDNGLVVPHEIDFDMIDIYNDNN